MAGDIPKVNVAAQDRVLLHLLAQDEWANRYMVPPSMTRPGIAEACAQHPPNVSRTMRNLLRKRWWKNIHGPFRGRTGDKKPGS